MLQAVGKAAQAPVMNPTHYAWPTTMLLAQLDRGTSSKPSTYVSQAEGFLNQWVCQGRVRLAAGLLGCSILWQQQASSHAWLR